jgi:hypothetical protein
MNLPNLLVGCLANSFLLALELDEELAVQTGPRGGMRCAVRQLVRADAAVDGGCSTSTFALLLLVFGVQVEISHRCRRAESCLPVARFF